MRARRKAPPVRRNDKLEFFEGTGTDLFCRVAKRSGSILSLDTEGLIGFPDTFQVRVLRSGALLRLKSLTREIATVRAEILELVEANTAAEAA